MKATATRRRLSVVSCGVVWYNFGNIKRGKGMNIFTVVGAFLTAVLALGASGSENAGGMLEMRNIAHRGMWDKDIPQNTKEAIKRAYDEGAAWVETDFYHTKSGQMIAIHAGKELRKYTNCSKEVCDLTPDDIATLNLAPPGSGKTFRIPLIHEVLAVVPKHGVLQAEIKGYSPTYADVFDAAVKEAGLSETNIVVSSFYYDALKDFKARYPKYRTVWLWAFSKKKCPITADECIAKCKAAKIEVFCPAAFRIKDKMTVADVDKIRAAGIEFRMFGVNTPAQLKLAKEFGATGFTCNHWHEAFKWAEAIGGIKLLR